MEGRARDEPLDVAELDEQPGSRAELREVVDCIAHDRESDVLGGALARDAIRICDAETKSLTTGRPERI